MAVNEPAIRDLAVIGDRRTAALVAADGSIVWYCPGRFDSASLFASLLDAQDGGTWKIELPAGAARGRAYLEDSGVLESRFEIERHAFTVTDWMPMGAGCPRGICRLFSPAPRDIAMTLKPAPDYGRAAVALSLDGQAVCIQGRHWLYASGRLQIGHGAICVEQPAGEPAWLVLADAPMPTPSHAQLLYWLEQTLAEWRGIASEIKYYGPFEKQVAQSLRALRLMTYAPNGGIIAAATTSLPEVEGGQRNYDYRYVWLRDAAMIVGALVRAGSRGADERHFLAFICGSRSDDAGESLLPPFVSLDLRRAPDESQLSLKGYAHSRPVRIGNGASHQWQLDGFGNVLLAAHLIYTRHETREHWETVRLIADYVAEHWREPDYGIWEESVQRQFTTGKVIASCGLRYIADCAEDGSQAKKWRAAADEIDDYVARHCINAEGAYRAFVGSEAVDVSAALYPVWGYIDAQSAPMVATLRVLERDYARDDLYWRHLEEPGPGREGAFLAATFWVAQYWIMRDDLTQARRILEAALAYGNDLGLFAEQADPASGKMLGNFPQSFVHAAFIGAVLDYRNAAGASSRVDRSRSRSTAASR
jgi:GH15 family glucan-1,4-alpha-glucosidase